MPNLEPSTKERRRTAAQERKEARKTEEQPRDDHGRFAEKPEPVVADTGPGFFQRAQMIVSGEATRQIQRNARETAQHEAEQGTGPPLARKKRRKRKKSQAQRDTEQRRKQELREDAQKNYRQQVWNEIAETVKGWFF
jgi:hypothetical protein